VQSNWIALSAGTCNATCTGNASPQQLKLATAKTDLLAPPKRSSSISPTPLQHQKLPTTSQDFIAQGIPIVNSEIAMSSSKDDHELLPEQTAGFKVGEKKTIDEYNSLGKETRLMFTTRLVPVPFGLASTPPSSQSSFYDADQLFPCALSPVQPTFRHRAEEQ
jgi:hypothetical protein